MLKTREQKQEFVSNLAQKLGEAKATFVVDYIGMNVEQVTGLRKKLTGLSSEMKVVRNTLARRALNEGTEGEKELAEELTGTNAFVFSYDDVSASAKALVEISKEIEHLKLKTGVMDGAKLDEGKIKYLATLPSKDVLRAQLLSLMNTPATQMARVLNAGPQGFLNVLSAYKDTKE